MRRIWSRQHHSKNSLFHFGRCYFYGGCTFLWPYLLARIRERVKGDHGRRGKQKKAPVQMLRSSEASPYPIQQMRATVATGRKDDKEEPPLWGLANSMVFNSSKEDVPVQRLRRLARSSYPIQQRRVLPPPRGDAPSPCRAAKIFLTGFRHIQNVYRGFGLMCAL